MLVGDIMRSDVKTAEAEDTFADVAKIMRSNGISSVIVLEKGNKLGGILTERDVVNLVAAGGDPALREGRAGDDASTPRDDRAEGGHRRGGRPHGVPQHPPPAGGRSRQGHRHHLDPRPDEVGRRGALDRPRDCPTSHVRRRLFAPRANCRSNAS